MPLLTDQTPDLLHVGRVAHEAQGNPVHPLAQAECQVGFVLLRQSTH